MIIIGNVEENSSVAHKYHLFKIVNNNTSARFLESVSEQFIIRHLPFYMNNVLDSISKKGITCSSSQEINLNFLWHLSKRQTAKEMMLMFESEQLFLIIALR